MKTKANKIDKFFELSYEAFESDNESIYEELGTTKEQYLDSKLKMIKRLKLKSIAQTNKAKNEGMLEIALQKVKAIIESSNVNLKMGLEELIYKRSPQFQFRNIEKLDENDLKELLNDLDILNIIEDLDNFNNVKQ